MFQPEATRAADVPEYLLQSACQNSATRRSIRPRYCYKNHIMITQRNGKRKAARPSPNARAARFPNKFYTRR